MGITPSRYIMRAAYSCIVPSNEALRLFGCTPGAMDQEAWPAYACMIVGETGKKLAFGSVLEVGTLLTVI